MKKVRVSRNNYIFLFGYSRIYIYDVNGNIKPHTTREGFTQTYTHDSLDHIIKIEGSDGEKKQYTCTPVRTDSLGRLSEVRKDGETLRSYGYDAFGNRTRMKEGQKETTYTYNAYNQLMSRVDAMNEETYAYDRRGKLSLIMENGTMKNSYAYGALNRLELSVNGKGEVAAYEYNGLGHRVGKTIGTAALQPDPMTYPETEAQQISQRTTAPDPMSRLKEQSMDPEAKIRYTIDLTRGYHNLLQKEEEGSGQTYLWDGNVAGMREEGRRENGLTDRSDQPVICYYF